MMADYIKAAVELDLEEYGEGWEEGLKELEFLCSTFQGSCPGDRNFGLPADILDGSPEQQQVSYIMAVTEQMEVYTPSLELVDTEFETDAEGKITARLFVEPSEGDWEDGEDEEEG